MIRIMLYDLAHRKKKRISAIAKETGIARSTITSIYHEKVKMIQLETINKLCEYFDCQPGDLIRFEMEEPLINKNDFDRKAIDELAEPKVR